MPDLTIEYFWICQKWHDQCKQYPWWENEELYKSYQGCRWDQFVDGGEPIDNKCPSCGGPVTSYGMGV